MSVTRQDITICLNAYKKHQIDDKRLLMVLNQLAEMLLKNEDFFSEVEKEDLIKESAILCFDKLHRLDDSKMDSAFNFFTTIILCYRNQMKRCKKNELKFKEMQSVS